LRLQVGLADQMRQRTGALHARAERSGIVSDILKAQVDRAGYALFLRNLLPGYQALEAALEGNRHHPGIAAIARPEVYRASALEADLTALSGPDWGENLPLLPASRALSARIAGLIHQDGAAGLVAHAYTRFLGDLNGGQMMMRLLARSLLLEESELNFYRFLSIPDIEVFKREYRAAIDRSGLELLRVEAVVEEAAVAFEYNIEISLAAREAVIQL
jgi:heme oxygenase